MDCRGGYQHAGRARGLLDPRGRKQARLQFAAGVGHQRFNGERPLIGL